MPTDDLAAWLAREISPQRMVRWQKKAACCYEVVSTDAAAYEPLTATTESELPEGALSILFRDYRPRQARMCVTRATHEPIGRRRRQHNPKPVGCEWVKESPAWKDARPEACHLLGEWTGAKAIISKVDDHFNRQGNQKLASLVKNMNLVMGTAVFNRGHCQTSLAKGEAGGGMLYVEQRLCDGLGKAPGEDGSIDTAQLTVTPLYAGELDDVPSAVIMDVQIHGFSGVVSHEVYYIANVAGAAEPATCLPRCNSASLQERYARCEERFFKDCLFYAEPLGADSGCGPDYGRLDYDCLKTFGIDGLQRLPDYRCLLLWGSGS